MEDTQPKHYVVAQDKWIAKEQALREDWSRGEFRFLPLTRPERIRGRRNITLWIHRNMQKTKREEEGLVEIARIAKSLDLEIKYFVI